MRISDWSSDVCSSDLALVDPVDESAEESSGEDLESIEGDSSDETVEATDEAAAADEADQDAEDVVDSDVDADVSDEQSVDQTPEDPLEEFRRALWAKPGDWYVVHTYSGKENREIGRAACRDRVCQYG